MSINGKVEEGTMEIDAANNMERFSTGSGADEAVEVHDFEIVSWNLELILPKKSNKKQKNQAHQHAHHHSLGNLDHQRRSRSDLLKL